VQGSKAELVVNPLMELNAVTREGSIASITLRAPVKGWGLKVTTIDKSEAGLFGALLVHMISGDQPAGLTAGESERLCEIGFLVAPESIANPVWYSCDVLNPPLDLVPRRSRSSIESQGDLHHLVVNPTLRHFGHDGPPSSMRGRVKLRNRFQPDRSWLWLQDNEPCSPSLYSYSPDNGLDVDDLVAGEAVTDRLDSSTRQRLLTAGVLQTAGDVARRRENRQARIAKAGGELRDRRYTVLDRVISPLQIAAARRYYREAIGEGFLVPGDKDWPNRPFSSRDPIGNFFHAQMNDLISEIAGVSLKPSFSFFASYRTGAELPSHKDRDQCEYAISILLDFAPEPADLSPWPIFVQPPDAPAATPISLGIGDAVLYFGREVRHHREVLAHAEYCSCWFFFYVDQNFDGPLD
jgi:hypothetical protein